VMPFRFSFEAKYQVKGAEQIRDRSRLSLPLSKRGKGREDWKTDTSHGE
jgi:hypothetical protein